MFPHRGVSIGCRVIATLALVAAMVYATNDFGWDSPRHVWLRPLCFPLLCLLALLAVLLFHSFSRGTLLELAIMFVLIVCLECILFPGRPGHQRGPQWQTRRNARP
jgi:hypothetical protein